MRNLTTLTLLSAAVALAQTQTVTSLTVNPLADPATPYVTATCTNAAVCSHTWSYVVADYALDGTSTAGSAAGSTSAGTPVMSPTEYNTIAHACVANSATWTVWRSGSGGLPASTGKNASTNIPCGRTSIRDDGWAGDGTVAPSVNTTGTLKVGGTLSVGTTVLPFGWIDVRSAPYNAKGDGVNCDDVAINAASAAANTAGGGVVFLPAGTYLACQAIWVKSNVTLRGLDKSNTKIKVANAVNSTLASNASSGQNQVVLTSASGFQAGQDVSILDNNSTGQYAGNGFGDSNRITAINGTTITLSGNLSRGYTTAAAAHIFTTFNALNLCTFTFAGGIDLVASGSTDAAVTDVEIDGNYANQIKGNYDDMQNTMLLARSDRLLVTRTYQHDGMYSDILSSHYLSGTDTGSNQIMIIDNRITGAWNAGNIHLHLATNSIISRNSSQSGTAVYCYLCTGNIFQGNTFSGAYAGYSVYSSTNNLFTGDSINAPTTYGLQLVSSPGNIIANETIITPGSGRISADAASTYNALQGLRIAGYEAGAENAASALSTSDLTNHAFLVNDGNAKTITEASCISDAGSQVVTVKVGSTTLLSITCVAPASYSRVTTDGTTGYIVAASMGSTAVAAGASLDLSGTANTTTKDVKLQVFGTVNQ